MKIIEFKNDELVISDEAYHVKAFRDIWDADTTDNHSYSLAICGFLYFFYHPGSDYNYIVDEYEKAETIRESLGLENLDFCNDLLYQRAVDIYKKLVITTSSKLVDNNKKRLSKLDEYLDNVNIDDDNVSKYTKAISDTTKLAVEIAEAEKGIFKDIEEQSAKVRGKVQLSIGDMGI